MRDVLTSLKIVFSKKSYIYLTTAVFFLLLIINAILINKGAINFVLDADFLDTSLKLKIVFNALLDTFYFLSSIEILLMIIIILLAGISVSMLLFFINNKIKRSMVGGVSVIGIIFSFLGIGCASCGLIILSSIIGFSAATSLLVFLPLNGIEFYFLSFILISISIFLISKKIQNPLLCKI